MTTSISVTRALTEIKHLSDRIIRATNEPFVGLAKGKDEKKVCVNSPTSSVADVESRLRANLQSVRDLIARRDALKRAVVTSNAATQVTIAGVKMTVAEAIEKKASVAFESRLVDTLRAQYATHKTKAEQENTKLLAEIDVAVQAAYGNEKGKVDDSQYEAVANPRLKLSQYSVIDPSNVEVVIADLSESITNFLQEVDFVLSESNAVTQITV